MYSYEVASVSAFACVSRGDVGSRWLPMPGTFEERDNASTRGISKLFEERGNASTRGESPYVLSMFACSAGDGAGIILSRGMRASWDTRVAAPCDSIDASGSVDCSSPLCQF